VSDSAVAADRGISSALGCHIWLASDLADTPALVAAVVVADGPLSSGTAGVPEPTSDSPVEVRAAAVSLPESGREDVGSVMVTTAYPLTMAKNRAPASFSRMITCPGSTTLRSRSSSTSRQMSWGSDAAGGNLCSTCVAATCKRTRSYTCRVMMPSSAAD